MQASDGDERTLSNIVAMTAGGHAFPPNLDRDRPIGRLASPTPADLLEPWPRVGRPTDSAPTCRRPDARSAPPGSSRR
jgi:hypothetical protein